MPTSPDPGVTPWRAASRLGVLLALTLLALAPAPAWAHGITDDAGDRSVLGFVPLGIEHMLLGWDHILFIGGVVLLAGEWRRAAKLITVFVIGHSLTLITATLAGWQVSPVLVDVVIVLSVVFVGGYGMAAGRPKRWDIFGGIVYLFGLVHGLGLATRFQALGVPEEGMLWRVIAFNVGIEIGQLTAIVGVLAVAAVVSLLFGRDREPVLRKGVYAALFGVGTIAAPLLAYQGLTSVDLAGPPAAFSPPAGSACTAGERTERFSGAGGGHTEKTFYAPDEETPMGDFGHSLLDGFVVVLYPQDLPPSEVRELRDYVVGHELEGVLAGPHPDASAQVEALTFEQRLTCPNLELPVIREFSDTWLTSVTHGA